MPKNPDHTTSQNPAQEKIAEEQAEAKARGLTYPAAGIPDEDAIADEFGLGRSGISLVSRAFPAFDRGRIYYKHKTRNRRPGPFAR